MGNGDGDGRWEIGWEKSGNAVRDEAKVEKGKDFVVLFWVMVMVVFQSS